MQRITNLLVLFITLFIVLSIDLTYSLKSLNRNPKTSLRTIRKPYSHFTSLSCQSSDIIIKNSTKNKQKTNLLTSLLGISYLSIICSMMTLPSVLSIINMDPIFQIYSQQTLTPLIPMSSTLTISTLFVMLGKFTLGPITDHLGGSMAMLISMILISIYLFVAATTQSSIWFLIAWNLVSLGYSASWGAIANVIRENMDESSWPVALGNVAAYSRLGAMGSSIIFGSLLGFIQTKTNIVHFYNFSKSGSWRSVFIAAGIFQSIISILFYFVSKDISSKTSTHSMKVIPTVTYDEDIVVVTIPKLLQDVSKKSLFWLMLIAKTSLMMVGHIMSFIPLYLVSGPLKMSSSTAASSSAVFSLGSMISSIYGTRLYEKLNTQKKHKLITFLNVIGISIPFVLLLQEYQYYQFHYSFVLFLLMTWGFAWALPFYIPPGIAALRLGGKAHSSLITNIFDAFGFFAGAIFSKYAMDYGTKSNWIPTLLTCTIGNILTAIVMFLSKS